MTAYVALAFSRDSRILCLAAPTSPVVRLWDVTAGVERATLEGGTDSVLALAISPDGITLAAADFQGAVMFWDLATLKIRPGRLRHAGVRSLAFAPDGRAWPLVASTARSTSGRFPSPLTTEVLAPDKRPPCAALLSTFWPHPELGFLETFRPGWVTGNPRQARERVG